MPRLNTKGEWAAGIGGGQASARGLLLATSAGQTAWVDDTRVVYGRNLGGRKITEEYDLAARVRREVAPHEPSFPMEGAAGVWAGGVGGGSPFVYTSTGARYDGAALQTVGPDGSVVVTPDYFAGLGMRIHRPTGTVLELPSVTGRFVHMPTPDVLVYTRKDRIAAWGLRAPTVAAGNIFWPRAIRLPDGSWWLVYVANEPNLERLLLQPWDEPTGYVLASAKRNLPAYRPDGIAWGATTARICYATNEGESLGSVVLTDVDLTKLRVSFRSAPTPTPPTTPPVQPPVVVPPIQEPTPVTLEPKRLPGDVQAIVNELYARNLDLANSPNDDDRRALAKKIAQTARARKGPRFGLKSNHGVTIAIGKDSIAELPEEVVLALGKRQLFYIWDLFNGTTRKPNQFPMNISDGILQFFVPVEPIDHLKDAVPVPVDPPVDPPVVTPVDPPPPPPSPPPQVDVALILEAIKAADDVTQERLARIEAGLVALIVQTTKPRSLTLNGGRFLGTLTGEVGGPK